MKQIRNVAVIDIGKTNAKVALYDLVERREDHVQTSPNAVLRDGPYPHYDIEGLWRFFLDSLASIGRQARIDRIVTAAHGASITLVDAAGDLALPMLDYEFEGPDSLKDDYDRIRPPFSETGSPRLVAGLNVGAQLHWLSRTFPEAFARTTSIMPYPQYWAMRLSGVRASEATSLGAHGDIWDPWRPDFSSLVDHLGWRPLFPPMSRPFDILGPLRAEIAAATGLAADTPVLSGIHDSNASLLTHLASVPPPFSVVSTGTWVICLSVGGRALALDERRDTLVNVDAFGNPVPSSRFMGGRAFAMLGPDASAPIADADRDQVLDGGVMLLPALPDDSGPYRGRKAEWRGDPASLGPGGYLYAVSLYLGMMTAVSLEAIGADGPVIVDGPFARNVTFLEALAVVTGRKVLIGGSGATGTSAGAALLALGPDARIASCNRVADVVPDPRIAGYAAKWRRLAEAGQG